MSYTAEVAADQQMTVADRVAHGGSVYFRGTRFPIDLESYWFEPVEGMLLRPEFLLPGPTPRDSA